MKKHFIFKITAVLALTAVTAASIFVVAGKKEKTTDVLAASTYAPSREEPFVPAVSGVEETPGSDENEESSEENSFEETESLSSSEAESTSFEEESSVAETAPYVWSLPAESRIVDYTSPESYSKLSGDVAALSEKYPELITLSSIGKTALEKDIFLLTLGKGSRKALAVAGIHAREHITVSYILRCVEEYAEKYYSEDGMYDDFYSIRDLLDEYTLYIVPNCNPDGSEILTSGGSVLFESYKPFVLREVKSNANGVDLNRNFPFLWDEINNEILSYNTYKFKGPSAASENETKALMNLCEENDFEWMLSFHIQGGCIYWRDEYNGAIPGDIPLINRLTYICSLKRCPVSDDVNGYGGGFENWFRSRFSKPGMCIELISVYKKVHPDTVYDHENFDSILNYSRTRYALIAAMYDYNTDDTVLNR